MKARRAYVTQQAIFLEGKRIPAGTRVELEDAVAAWFLDQAAISRPEVAIEAPRTAAAPNSSPRPRVGGCGACGWR
jgi:hypothetical protein